MFFIFIFLSIIISSYSEQINKEIKKENIKTINKIDKTLNGTLVDNQITEYDQGRYFDVFLTYQDGDIFYREFNNRNKDTVHLEDKKTTNQKLNRVDKNHSITTRTRILVPTLQKDYKIKGKEALEAIYNNHEK